MMIAPAMASADTSSTLTVIGTSDVSDSGLIPNVIQPGFTKQFPQYAFKYIGTGTGNAISQAESGAAGASVLIVHAASLENQFVANGYSQEKYGRALWINDFVLGGQTADPAGVKTGAPTTSRGRSRPSRRPGSPASRRSCPAGEPPEPPSRSTLIWQLMAQSGLTRPGCCCAASAPPTAAGGRRSRPAMA